MKFGKYKLEETLKGVVKAVDVPVINPGRYKLEETFKGVTNADEVAVIKL